MPRRRNKTDKMKEDLKKFLLDRGYTHSDLLNFDPSMLFKETVSDNRKNFEQQLERDKPSYTFIDWFNDPSKPLYRNRVETTKPGQSESAEV